MAKQLTSKEIQIQSFPEDWHPSENIANVDPNLYEVVWNDDYSLFTTKKLFWHDDSSYAKYQGGDMDHEYSNEISFSLIPVADEIDCDIDF